MICYIGHGRISTAILDITSEIKLRWQVGRLRWASALVSSSLQVNVIILLRLLVTEKFSACMLAELTARKMCP